MNEGAAWVSFFYFGLIVVIFGTMCSIQTIKYSSDVKKYEKRTVDIEDGQEIIIGNYGSCQYSEIKTHYTEGNETREITLISSPPPYDGIFLCGGRRRIDIQDGQVDENRVACC